MRTCTICSHEHYAEMIAELKTHVPRSAVAVKYKVDYTSLGRCFQDHTPHDQEFEVVQGINRTQKALQKELRKKLPDQNRLLVKDLETRLKDLRSEQRAIMAIKKESGLDLAPNGETLLTIESLDRLIKKAWDYRSSDWDTGIIRIDRLLRNNCPRARLAEVCRETEQFVKALLGMPSASPDPLPERQLLPVREMGAN